MMKINVLFFFFSAYVLILESVEFIYNKKKYL